MNLNFDCARKSESLARGRLGLGTSELVLRPGLDSELELEA